MAKATEDGTKRKRGGAEKTLTWLVTGMLILGLGGFGATSFGTSQSSVASVGGTQISANDYARAMRQEVANFSQQVGSPISTQQAIQFGLDQRAIGTLVTRAALDEAASRAGLSVGDQTVAEQVMKENAFIGASGSFDATTYRQTLRQNGWTEAEFEGGLRRDATRSLLSGAVASGFLAPEATTDMLLSYLGERRGFSMIRLSEGDLTTPLATPAEEAVRAYYDAHPDLFTKPEAKRIRYAALLPDQIAAEQPVDEARLHEIYNQRIAEFVVPPRRLVERLVYPDAAARDAALASGKSFEDLVSERGLTMDAVDMGDLAQPELGDAGAAIFAAALDSVIAAETPLGPALFRVNGELQGENTSFEEARADLATELQTEEAQRVISGRVDEIDDLLAGGATVEELAKTVGMQLAVIDHVPGRQGNDAIEGYQAFRQAADAVKKGDFPEAIVLNDGGVVAMEFVETVAPALIPYEEARDAALAATETDALQQALSAQAIAFKAEAEAGAPIGTLGITEVTSAIARDGSVAKAPADFLKQIFAMSEGEVRVIEEGDFIALVKLDHVTLFDPSTPDAAALKATLSSQLEQSYAQDAYAAFSDAVSLDAGIKIDQNAIATINTSLQ